MAVDRNAAMAVLDLASSEIERIDIGNASRAIDHAVGFGRVLGAALLSALGKTAERPVSAALPSEFVVAIDYTKREHRTNGASRAAARAAVAEGKAAAEPAERVWKQYAVDAVYRFLPEEKAYVGVRFNRAKGDLAGMPGVGADRWQIGGGWFILPGLLAKGEYVDQKYFGYPAMNVRNGGRFQGFVLEGVVGF